MLAIFEVRAVAVTYPFKANILDREPTEVHFPCDFVFDEIKMHWVCLDASYNKSYIINNRQKETEVACVNGLKLEYEQVARLLDVEDEVPSFYETSRCGLLHGDCSMCKRHFCSTCSTVFYKGEAHEHE
jgi:hypothetical protein